MKRQDITKLADQSITQLTAQLSELQVKLARARHQLKIGKLSNPRQVSRMSDDIARIKTVITTKQLAQAQGSN